MSALMSDVLEGTVTPQVANAACNAGGKLLKIVEMEYKYVGGRGETSRPRQTLTLTGTLPALPEEEQQTSAEA